MDAHEDGSITEHVRQRGVHMAVTELEENQINDMLYELDMCQDDEKKCANVIPMFRAISYNKCMVFLLNSQKGAKNMDYKAMRDRIEDMVNDNYKDFFKAIISIEKGINDESVLDKLSDDYMDNDSLNLLHDEFDYMIEKLREQGIMKRDIYLIENPN